MRKFSRLVFDAPRRDDDYRKADMCSVPRSGTVLVAEVPVAGRSGYDGSCLAAKTRSYLRPANQHPNSSGSGSEEEYMSEIALSLKGARLVELCEAAGFRTVDDLRRSCQRNSLCPAICMGCAAIAEMERDQRQGYCEACGRSRMVSGLVLAGFI
jgi:hypothetical protein